MVSISRSVPGITVSDLPSMKVVVIIQTTSYIAKNLSASLRGFPMRWDSQEPSDLGLRALPTSKVVQGILLGRSTFTQGDSRSRCSCRSAILSLANLSSLYVVTKV